MIQYIYTIRGVIIMKFVSFYFRYKYRVMIVIFLLSSIFVALMWRNYSDSILLNLLIPIESAIFTIVIPLLIETQSSYYEKYRMMFFACTDLSHLKKYIKTKDDSSKNILFRSMHDHLVSHLDIMKRLFRDDWENYFIRNYEKKMMKYETKLNEHVEKHMPNEMKQVFVEKRKVDLRYQSILDVFSYSRRPYESVYNFLSETNIKTEENTFRLTDEYFYFIEGLELDSRKKELECFANNIELCKIVESYYKLVKKYAKATFASLFWFHKLYDPQLYNSSVMNGIVDEIADKVTLAVTEIQDDLNHQKDDIEELLDNVKNEILDKIPDDNH